MMNIKDNTMNVSPTVNLNEHQKVLLAMIMNAPDSPKGGKRVHLSDEKLVNAKKTLAKIGFIQIHDSQLMTVTDRGIVSMKEDGLIDETGQLTPKGLKYAEGNTKDSQPDPKDGPMENARMTFKQYLMLG